MTDTPDRYDDPDAQTARIAELEARVSELEADAIRDETLIQAGGECLSVAMAELATLRAQAERDAAVIAAAEALIRTQVSVNEQPQIDSRALDALIAAARSRNGAAGEADA